MRTYQINRFLIAILLLFSSSTLWSQSTNLSYKVETISMPEGLSAETGAVEFLPDGRLVASFTRGEVMIFNPLTKEWKLFAEGLHDPLGILVISNSELLVMQRPELTRIKDIDGDGKADLYEKVIDDFGLSGNYHEFNYGPVKDSEGNLFIALNSSSGGGDIRNEVRGEINPLGRDKSAKGQMFSNTPYRGWVMKLNASGELEPIASGFRSPNGIGFDEAGNLFVTENQGDWIGTSALHHVQKGKFYGHPGALVWERGWNRGNPFFLALPLLDSMRTKGAVLFPHGIIANSPTQPIVDVTKGKFGPFSGQLLVGEMNRERIVRVMLERIGGELQGACTPFLDGNGLRKGNNRLAFAPDGSLWVGQNSHGWLGDEGIQRVTFTGKQPLDILSMNLTEKGFDLVFTQPLNKSAALDMQNYSFRHYFYKYHSKYGSDQFDVQDVPVTAIQISEDLKKVSLTLSALKPGYVYELNLGNITTVDGDDLNNKVICYTLNRLKESNF